MSSPHPSVPTVTAAFLEAASVAGDVIDTPLVDAAWERASVLKEMTVGAIAGHLFLVIRHVDKQLDEPEPVTAPTVTPRTFPWLRVDDETDLERAEHRQVRADGQHVAAWGWHDVVRAYRARVKKVATRLAASDRHAFAFGDLVMSSDSFLTTRIVEVLVHADDLATSVDLPMPTLPPAAATLALHALVEASRSIHGDLDVLRSFTRRERSTASAPTVL